MSQEPHPDLPDDPQTQRTRWELWSIVIIVVVVMVASLAWRAMGHHPAAPSLDQTLNTTSPVKLAPPDSVAAPAHTGP